jgi:flagellar FliJ protein
MAKTFTLQTLLDLAEERSEAAARKLTQLKQALVLATAKRDQLAGFKSEYFNRLQQATEAGITIDQWRDYNAFIEKIGVAIHSQNQEIVWAQARWDAMQLEWMAREREVNAYRTLKERFLAEQLQIELKQEQRLQDEFNNNMFTRKNTPNNL